MSVTSPAYVKMLVETGLTDEQLQLLIDAFEAEITAKIGNPYVDASTPITEMVMADGCEVFVKRPIASLSSVTDYGSLSDVTGTVLTENESFFAWKLQGRLTRLPMGSQWGPKVQVVYVTTDDREKWKGAVADLVRLQIARMPMMSESVAGEFSYSAPHWEAEKRKIIKRLSFQEI